MAILYVWSGAAGSASGADWANAKLTLTAAFSTEVAGDTLYVAHDHAESTAGAVTLASSGTVANTTKIICVNRAGSVPPVAADRRTTATVSTTLSNNLTLTGCAHYDGIIFTAGSSTGTTTFGLSPGSGPSWMRFDNCSLRLGGTGASSMLSLSSSGALIEFNNTTVSFAAVGQFIQIGMVLKWRNTPSALLGTIPTTLFTPEASTGGEVEAIGVDLSAAGSGKTIFGSTASGAGYKLRLLDCKLDAAVTKSIVPAAIGANDVDIIRSGSAGVNYTVHRHRANGLLIEELTIIRTGGATDGTTPLSWKVVTTANCSYSMPFECPPIAIWNDTTGSSVTATVEGIWGGGAVPLDNEIWLDVEYLGSGASPQGSFVNDGMANLLTAAANQTSSSETWGGSTTTFKLSCTFTPQMKGWVYCRVRCGKPSSTFYVDPLVTLT